MTRSQKAWLRKHQPSYWSVWFGKNKKKDKGSDTDISSRVAQQGSVQFNPQEQFAGQNAPPPAVPRHQYQHQPPPDDYPPPHQQYAPHDVPEYQRSEFNNPLGSLLPSPHHHEAGAAHFPEFNSPLGSPHRSPAHHVALAGSSRFTNSPPLDAEEGNEPANSSERTETHGQPSMRRRPGSGQESFRTGERIPSMRWSPERGLESFRTGEIPYVPETVRVNGARTKLGGKRNDELDEEDQ
ncbi:hypothetical protein HBI56_053630 [Parastagonospora nodorum]|uniref:Uncharacterized protein n=2 Tax=Phaeosphaeria nodorum (strain SN15 / ATCC MYA-4574 / FGSC 10173) TaxID=321614 RepID=A0A7U2NR73_PHANO|nr:hypothetical protein SNOG_13228 [Parastagonospora nodorum SN15]KAH3914080.1 hypothetical protein HBH56_098450 [Parastagonospora nodorum]EAT79555.1 hypothetical protein SNOG_13228 [Parastagonospora nodorum SN15]KAH3930539.1 hypothetical protein HBH54_112770 [Parastagonospora nodorum]KAH3938970.1 hypothetical protein HBH53_241900 [Parastagonospora nodorum]KAH3964665.1 hypothetical protein HBH51_159250 [Parastagonospora nodorum]